MIYLTCVTRSGGVLQEGLQLTLLQNGENAFVRECGPLQTLLSSSLLMHCQDQPGSQTALQYPDTEIGKGSG